MKGGYRHDSSFIVPSPLHFPLRKGAVAPNTNIVNFFAHKGLSETYRYTYIMCGSHNPTRLRV